MGYRIERDETVDDAVRRITSEQVAKAIDEIEDAEVDVHEAVHEVRKRCKKIRGLVRLVRPAFPGYSAANARFRDLARQLAPIRDATTLLEAFDMLMGRVETVVRADAFAPVRAVLRDRRDTIAEDLDASARLDAVRADLQEAAAAAEAWDLDDGGADAVVHGLGRTFRRATAAMAEAYDGSGDGPAAERFHEWRKRVKYHRYHARLLRRMWDPVLDPWRDEAKRLSDLLGDDHDLAELRAVLAREADRFEDADLPFLHALIDLRQEELRRAARPLGRRLFAEKPRHHVRRHAALWRAWRAA